MATCLDWELMSCLSARQRTADEFKRVVESAGLKIVGHLQASARHGWLDRGRGGLTEGAGQSAVHMGYYR